MPNKRAVGATYEKRAAEHLKTLGYEIVEYNFYSRIGEIDIIAKHEGYLVFVEVKYRENTHMGHPLEAVSTNKRRTICKCAAYYLKRKHLYDEPIRFDVVAILGEQIQVIQNAFDYME